VREISLHILDIAENCVNADAKKVIISINQNLNSDKLLITIIDDGNGMAPEAVAKVYDPFVTSRKTRKVGLGIPFLKAAAEATNGYLKIESEVDHGTKISTKFQLSHIDRMPLGDIETTLLSLMVGFPKINWIFNYQIDQKAFTLDDKSIKDILGVVQLSEPTVIKFLKKYIHEGIESVTEK
jgi:anti-sigma regulatory factor (Ser/Thr protein kinase)